MVRLTDLLLKYRYPITNVGGGYVKARHKVIRLQMHGCANRPFFQIILTNRWRPETAPGAEQLGTFDPMPNTENQKLLALNLERCRYWIGRGAVPSQRVSELMGLIGFLPINPRTIMTSWRARRSCKVLSELEQQEKERQQSEAGINQTQSVAT